MYINTLWISGSVTSTSGTPLKNAEVSVVLYAGGLPVGAAVARTDYSGYYIVRLEDVRSLIPESPSSVTLEVMATTGGDRPETGVKSLRNLSATDDTFEINLRTRPIPPAHRHLKVA